MTINEIVVRHANDNADVARISCVYQRSEGDVITMSDDLNDVQDVNEVNNSFNACEEHVNQ